MLALALATSARAQTVRSDLAMTNGPVSAAVVSGSRLYLGGSFTRVGPATGSGAPVDTVTGAVLPGFPAVTGTVQAVIPDGAGGWFLGGSFSSVGGVPRQNLAHVLADLSVSPWDPSPDQTVYALARANGVVYAGGDFLAAGGEARAHLAAIDSASGLALAWDPGADGSVRALALTDSVLYAGGSFLTAGGASRARIAALDLATGAASPWNPGSNGSVFALAAGSGVVYTGGFFSSLGGLTRIDLGAVDAGTGATTPWNPQPDNQVFALALAGTRLYVGGQFARMGGNMRGRLAAVDAGTGATDPTWNPSASGRVFALELAGGHVYAGGEFTFVGSQTRTFVAALDTLTGAATAWDAAAYGMVRALAASGPALYVGGSFNGIGGAVRRSLAAIDLATGAVAPWDPGTDGSVLALEAHGPHVLVGGQFGLVAGQTRFNLAALDTASGTPTAWDPNADGAVTALAVDHDRIYAGGTFSSIGGLPRNDLASFDAITGLATAWDPNADGQVFAIVPHDGIVYVGGAFLTVGGQNRRALAAVDTTTGAVTAWNPNPNGTVRALVPTCGQLFAGGFFTTIGGQARSRLALLDAASGLSLPWNPGANGPVLALELADGALYTSGLFTVVGGQSRTRIAALSPATGAASAWNPGCDNVIQCFATDGSSIYAGGSFATIGGATASFVAGLSADGTYACPPIAMGNANVSPARIGDVISRTLTASGGVAPYCWDLVTGTMPPGLTLGFTSGTLAGTLTTAGSFAFTITATDARGCTVTHAFDWLVRPTCPPLALLPATLPNAHVGEAYAETLTVSGAAEPVSYQLAAGALPAGLTLGANGVLAGTPTTPGNATFTIAFTDSGQCGSTAVRTMSVFPACTPVAFSPALLPTGVVGTAYDQTLVAAGAHAPLAWTLEAGSLPAGLVLDTATGRLHGTPSAADTTTLVVSVRDSFECTRTHAWPLAIFAAPPASLVAANTGALVITNGRPCASVPVVLTRAESSPVRTLRVAVAIDTARFALCDAGTPAANFHPGAWLGGRPDASLAVTTLGAGAWLVDVALADAPCGIDSSGTLFTMDVTASHGDGSGTIRVDAVAARDCDGAWVAIGAGAPATLVVDRQPLVVQPAALPGGVVGTPYAATFTTTAGSAPITWSLASGTLPAGLALAESTGALAGTPTTAATHSFVVQASDVFGRTGTNSYTVAVFATAPGSVVAAVATDLCLTNTQPQVPVPFVYTRVESAGVSGVSVTFQIDTAKVALATPADPTASVHEGSWFGAHPSLLLVTAAGGGVYTVDGVVLGPPCDRTLGGELFSVDLKAVGADGAAAITVLAVTARDCANASVPVAPGPAASLVVDRGGPPPVADLAAHPLAVAGANASTTRITIDWTPGIEVQSDLYRAPRGSYPLYSPGALPDSTLVPNAPWVHVATNPAPGYVDQPAVRGAYVYVLVTTDSCGATARSNRTSGTVNYLLGDVTNGLVRGTGDDKVALEDVSLLGAHYGASGASADSVGYLDVGPTASGLPDSRPLPDHQLDLEDLFIFASNYGVVAGPPALARRPLARTATSSPEHFTLSAPIVVASDAEILATLRMEGGGRLQAFSARLTWDAGVVEPIGVESGGFVESQEGVVLSPRPGTVDAALLGTREVGLTGAGDVARVRFRVLRAGQPGIAIANVDGRDAANRAVSFLSTTDAELAPARTLLLAPAPNPAPGATTVSYALARSGPVALGIYEVGGRRVRTLASGVQQPGAYHVRWDGRDDGGRRLAPGVYYVALDADGRRSAHKLVLLR